VKETYIYEKTPLKERPVKIRKEAHEKELHIRKDTNKRDPHIHTHTPAYTHTNNIKQSKHATDGRAGFR